MWWRSARAGPPRSEGCCEGVRVRPPGVTRGAIEGGGARRPAVTARPSRLRVRWGRSSVRRGLGVPVRPWSLLRLCRVGVESRPARDAALARHVPSIRHAGPTGRRRLRPTLRGALHNQLPTSRQPLRPIVSGTPHAANAEAEVSLWRVSQGHLRRSPSSRWLLAWLCLASAPLSVRWRRQETSDGAAQSCEICRDALTRQMRE